MHALAPPSQFRMREETVVEKAVSLPLVRRLAFDAGFTRMRVVPLRSPGTYTFDCRSMALPADPAGDIRIPIDPVGPGYLEALGTTLIGGRFFTDRDDPQAPPAAIVNEAAARRPSLSSGC